MADAAGPSKEPEEQIDSERVAQILRKLTSDSNHDAVFKSSIAALSRLLKSDSVAENYSRVVEQYRAQRRNSGEKSEEMSDQEIIRELEVLARIADKTVGCEDIFVLYGYALEAHQAGRYCESFRLFRPALPFLANNPLIWIRMTECCVYELFQGVSPFDQLYEKMFLAQNRPRSKRSHGEGRPPDMTIDFAECSSLVSFTIAQSGTNSEIQLSAAQLAMYISVKLRKYKTAFDIISWIFKKKEQGIVLRPDQNAAFDLYRTECFLAIGYHSTASNTAGQIKNLVNDKRVLSRAAVAVIITHLRRADYCGVMNSIRELLDEGYHDEEVQESVILLGMLMAYTLRSDRMLFDFSNVLQEIVK